MYGDYIRAARERAGLSPADVARAVGYDSADMIYKIEKDKANASIEMLDKIAGALGVRIGDLLPNSGANPVSDRFEPLMAAMFGLDERSCDELILNLAAQARILIEWRRRDKRTQPLQTETSAAAYTPAPTPKEDRVAPPLRRDGPPAWEDDDRGHGRQRGAKAPQGRKGNGPPKAPEGGE